MVIEKMAIYPLFGGALPAKLLCVALVSLCIAMAVPDLKAAEIAFQVSKDATQLQGLIVPDSQSLGGGYLGFDFWDEFSHGDIFGPLYDARPNSITGIELAYFDYAPLEAGHTLAPLDVDLAFQNKSTSTTVLNLLDASGAATGVLDLWNSSIGPDLRAMLEDYRFDPALGAAEDPVIMRISSEDSGFADVSGAASYSIRITVADAADIPDPPVIALLGAGASIWWLLWPWFRHRH
ncbi:MAG TPA: hypothetical protein DDY14_02550 [Chromatiaceae bacterium]|nr:MAG: hypothetical protein N838_06385 [Thiohalocapsa sp. PB-PSB1]HBG94207.1 hypothetical protein [Chromatiaceae bacterium]